MIHVEMFLFFFMFDDFCRCVVDKAFYFVSRCICFAWPENIEAMSGRISLLNRIARLVRWHGVNILICKLLLTFVLDRNLFACLPFAMLPVLPLRQSR